MPKQIYTLKDTDDTLIIKSGFGFKGLKIFFNNNEIGGVERKDLKKINNFTLDDKRNLTVQMVSSFLLARLNLKVNDEHIPNSPGDPKRIRRIATLFTLFFAISNIIIGSVIINYNKYDREVMDWGVSALFFGVTVFLLSIWMYASKSKIAVIITTIIAVIELIATILVMVIIEKFNSVFILKLFWIIHLVSAIDASKIHQESTQFNEKNRL